MASSNSSSSRFHPTGQLVEMETSNDARRRASLRVKQKQRRDSRTWSIDGRRKQKSSHSRRRPLSLPKSLHTNEWNERFIFDDGGKPVLSANAAKHTKLRPARSAGGLPTPNKRGSQSFTRHFSERSDGELVTVFSRCEIEPSQAVVKDGNDALGFSVDTANVGVSPFDMKKVLEALEADGSDTEGTRHAAGSDQAAYHQVDSPCKSKQCDQGNCHEKIVYCTSPKPGPGRIENISTEDLEQFEELLYTLEIEEGLVHRELVEQQVSHKKRVNITQQQLTCTNEEKIKFPSEAYENSQDPCIKDGDVRTAIISIEKKEHIYNYGWSFKKSTDDLAKDLIKNGKLEFHEIVRVLTESILDSCITEISNDIEAIVQESAEQIFQTL